MSEEKNPEMQDQVAEEIPGSNDESKREKMKQALINAIDENGNGEIDIEDVIVKGIRIPGIRIARDDFLQAQLMMHYPQEIIDRAIAESPMRAGIPVKEIDKIADAVIQHERLYVSGISTALGVPGGFAMVATIPADIAQYYGYLLRATQIDTNEVGGKLDDATLNVLIVCFGVMYGTVGANNAIKSIAKALGVGVEKQLLRKALTKGTIYPIVKSTAKWFGVKMTKDVFAGFFKKSIPLLGGILGGGLTYVSFKPCCVKLKSVLRDTILSNPDYKPGDESDIIDVTADEAED